MKILARLALLLLLPIQSVAQSPFDPAIEIVPAQPRYMERVTARIRPPFMWNRVVLGASASMVGNVITIRVEAPPECCERPFEVDLGSLPEGTYTVAVPIFGAGSPSRATFTVAPAMYASGGYRATGNFSGFWWNPAEPGSGISIQQGPTDEFFATWMVYDDRGEPTWYVFNSTQPAFGNHVSGTLYRTTGSTPFGTFDPARSTVSEAGRGSLGFLDSETLVANFLIDGRQVLKTMKRMKVE